MEQTKVAGASTTSLTAAITPNRLKPLDSIRAFATAAVFLFHAGYLLSFSDTDVFTRVSVNGGINWHHLVYELGTVGVSVFFVLSGFLLFYQLCKEDKPLTKERLKEYIKKRLCRILPLYYFSLIVIVLVFRHDMLSTVVGVKSIIYNLMFVRGIKNATGGGGTLTINPVYWSLVVEMHFYVLLPIFYSLFYRYKKSLLWFMLPVVLGLIYRSVLVYIVHDPSMQLMRFTPANFDFFAFGMCGAYLYAQRSQYIQRLGKLSLQTGLLVVFFLFIYVYKLDFAPTVSYIFAPTLFGAITTLAMLALLLYPSVLVRAVTAWPVLYLAKISYSVYIWHAIIIQRFDPVKMNNELKFFSIFVLTIITSTITYYVIEAPFLKIKTKRLPVTL